MKTSDRTLHAATKWRCSELHANMQYTAKADSKTNNRLPSGVWVVGTSRPLPLYPGVHDMFT